MRARVRADGCIADSDPPEGRNTALAHYQCAAVLRKVFLQNRMPGCSAPSNFLLTATRPFGVSATRRTRADGRSASTRNASTYTAADPKRSSEGLASCRRYTWYAKSGDARTVA